ncbi:hypothetical protein [Desulfovibrio sp. UCD-KL4C]|uniref:hypothetical protein n=1 Tax=Desulfovibrio sp. UCD-KL4C TaxID=2578120 RepID=UPI0025B7C73F|nr:hypothetical protein [Desulfovibrio sp. UCD-KL4C]
MRKLIFKTLTTAAIAAGLPETINGKETVYEAPVTISDQMLPKPRIEIQIMDVAVKPSGRKLSKFPSPNKETTHRTIRTAKDLIVQPVRMAIIANDEKWLEDFAHSLHSGLPRRVADRYNNNVSIQVEAVKSSGGGTKLVKIDLKTKLVKIFHIRFSGYVTTDSETPWIKDTDINTDYKREG